MSVHRHKLVSYFACGLVVAIISCAVWAVRYGPGRPASKLQADQQAERAGKSSQDGGTAQPELALSDEGRRHIWEIEQRAFQISYKAGPAITAAIAQADRATLLEYFHPEFEGTVASAETVEQVDRASARFSYWKSADRTLNREQFVDWLLAHVRDFASKPRAQLSLLYLKPREADSAEGEWQGVWILRVFGQSIDAGPQELILKSGFVANTLRKDLAPEREWIKSWNLQSLQIARCATPLMEEIGSRTGIQIEKLHDNWTAARREFRTTPGGLFACDYNGDRITDLLLTDRGVPTLYKGMGNARFDDVTLLVGIPLDALSLGTVAFADFDNDGDEDLVLASAVFENRDGYFVRRALLRFQPEAVGISVADFDRDGLVDFYVSNAAPPPRQSLTRTSWIDDNSGVPNQLFRNTGNYRFEDVTQSANAGAGNRSSFTSVWLDADDDNWPDLYVINELGNNLLLHNEGNGKFSEQHIGPADDGFAMGVSAGDVDGDGRPDLYLGNMYSKAGHRIIANIPPGEYPPGLIEKMKSFVSGNLLLMNRGGLRFEVADAGVSGVGWAYGTAMVDLDGDGTLDLYGTAGFASFSRSEPDG